MMTVSNQESTKIYFYFLRQKIETQCKIEMYFLPPVALQKKVLFSTSKLTSGYRKRIINWEIATQNTFFQTFMDFLTNFEFSVYMTND